MQNYELTLASPVADSFRCVKAANSLDIDMTKKSVHHFKVAADIKTPFNIGVVVGASGSGKTTLAKYVWGEEVFKEVLDLSKPVIDQFPEQFSYDECASMLAGVGLTSVPCWIRPAYTLSNGQRARAECALQMAQPDREMIVIDEWTSVVDRTVAKVMSHCIAKHARKTGKRIVLLSCHYDVLDWLNPDWVIDCNKQEYVDRRLLCPDFKRDERLHFDIREVGRESWKYFSKYHYLSDVLPGGVIRTYGLFHGNDQIGFQCFANYTPRRPGTKMKMHSNRTVIHPDYAGLGMGIMLINKTSAHMVQQGFEVWAKFSSTPVYLAMKRQAQWKLINIERKTKTVVGGTMLRKSGFREDVKTYSFRFIEQAEIGS
jgi:ABC-type ATPase with predicted acetyltransferase domain